MLKRQTELTPHEKRVRRLRAIIYSSFAVFLVSILLAIAWFGAAATSRNPPTHIVLAKPADATLIVRVDGLHAAARALLPDDDSPSDRDRFEQQLHALQNILGDTGEIFYWSAEEPGGVEFLAWFPLRRSQRLYVNRVSRELQRSGLFLPFDATGADPQLGYFRVDGRGVIISSRKAIPEFQIKEGEIALVAEARYTAPEGFLPPFLLRQLPAELVQQLSSQPPASLTIQWRRPPEPDGVPFASMTLLLLDGAEITQREIDLPYFHPLILQPSKGTP